MGNSNLQLFNSVPTSVSRDEGERNGQYMPLSSLKASFLTNPRGFLSPPPEEPHGRISEDPETSPDRDVLHLHGVSASKLRDPPV